MTSLLLLTRAMPSRLPLYFDLVRWSRPAGWLLLLWPTLAALWVASAGFPGWHLLAVFTAGTVLMRSAGCCVNDVADRDFDRHVKRTAQRPVTRGAVSVHEALIVAAVLALAAFILVLTTNASTVIWSFVALAITVAYPYAKRHVAMPQAVLGLAFSVGIPMAFTAVQGDESWIYTAVLGADSWLLAAIEGGVPGVAWWLLLGNMFWVLAYDTEYAMVDRDDDLRIGMKTSAITLGRFDVPAVVVCYLLFLASWAMALRPYHLGPAFDAALAIAVVQVFWHWTMIRRRTREGCFRAFRVNHWLGFTMFVGVAAGFAFRDVSRLG